MSTWHLWRQYRDEGFREEGDRASRGTIFHGAVVLYCPEQDEDAVGDYLASFVIDPISSNDNSQYSWAVLPIFYSIVARISL